MRGRVLFIVALTGVLWGQMTPRHVTLRETATDSAAKTISTARRRRRRGPGVGLGMGVVLGTGLPW